MSSSQEFVDYIIDQIENAGVITFRKMFGEYALYCNGKVVALICDDQLFVKQTKVYREVRKISSCVFWSKNVFSYRGSI